MKKFIQIIWYLRYCDDIINKKVSAVDTLTYLFFWRENQLVKIDLF